MRDLINVPLLHRYESERVAYVKPIWLSQDATVLRFRLMRPETTLQDCALADKHPDCQNQPHNHDKTTQYAFG